MSLPPRRYDLLGGILATAVARAGHGTALHDAIAELIWERCRKRPLIMPVVVDV